MFMDQTGSHMEVYMDELLVKNRTPKQHLTDLHEILAILRHYQIKLNPVKCAFGVEFGKLLGFMVSERGIEANQEKVKAMMNMALPWNVNEVQRLIK